jgi:segregation and condensation protein A
VNVLTPARAARAEQLVLSLDGFEGPLDLLLDLARAQKVDLSRISILALVEQYLAVIEGARRIRLELAADWLVMAAWLAWLKSRLLIPDDEADDDTIEDATDRLAARLAELERIRALGAWLDARPTLGRDVFRRGAPESFVVADRTGLRLDIPSLLGGYLAAVRRVAATRVWRPARHEFWTVAAALDRLERMLGAGPGWTDLAALLPPDPRPDPTVRNAALASTFLAALELARRGACQLSQTDAFAPVLLRPAPRSAHP